MSDDKKSSQPGLGKTFGIVAILTVLSKIIGLVRDIVVAHAYGTGIVADAYNYAYLFTGNVLILFGGLGGPFHSSTVAILTGRKDDEKSGKLVLQITIVTFLVLLALTIAAFFLAPFIADATLSNYKIIRENLHPDLQTWSDQRLHGLMKEQVLKQFAVMSPLIVISGLVGISYGVLNVYNKIFWPSLSPAIASIAIVVAVAGFADPASVAYTGIPLAVGTLIGALGQLIAQIPDMFKSGLKWSFSARPEAGTSEYSKMLWPAVFSTSVGQLTVYVDAFFTQSLGQGAWTAILMSNRLVQLPLGVLLTAMLVPILPRFTEHVDADRMDDLKEELRRSLRFLWFLALPLTALFFAIPRPIVHLLFQHGNFTAESTEIVTIALLFLAPSIFFYVARDLTTRVFYAFKDSETPFRVALIAIVVKAFLDWYFVYQAKLDVRGISLASTIITLVNLSLLTWFLRRKIGLLGFSKLVKPLAIMFLASFLCGGIAYLISNFLTSAAALDWVRSNISHFPSALERLQLLIGVAAASLCGGVAYLGTCIVCRLEEPTQLAKRVPLLKRIIR